VKNNLVFRILTLVLFFGLITLEIFGQTSNGKIVGKVTDKKTGETLIGLNVKVTGLTNGASTDVEGRYILAGIPAGKYTLQFTYVGYATKTISDVVVSAGTVTTLDAAMDEPAGNQLQTVVVNVSAKKESTAGLYAQQKSSVRVSDGITADQIKKSPDRSTSDVLKRVSGTSIQDNKFVVVRGLSDRYNSTLLNNAPVPSSEPDRKAFSFDVVPSNLIDQVVINKTAAADLPGDFSGGVIQMKTKDFPDQKVLDINYSVGYNSQATFNDFKYGQRGGIDFLGFDDGTRQFPTSFPSSRLKYETSPLSQKVQYSRQFKNTWGVNQSTAIPNQSIQAIFGDSYMLKNENKLGMILSLSYRNSEGLTNQTRADYDSEGSAGIDSLFFFQDNVYVKTVTLGALANLSYTSGKSKYSFKNLYNRSFQDSYTDRIGKAFQPNFDQKNTELSLVEKNFINSIFEAEHLLNSKNVRLDWNLSYTLSNRDQPDLRRLYYSRTEGSNEPFQAAIPVNNVGSPKNAGRFFQQLDDNVFGAAANFTYPFKWKNRAQSLKIGTLNSYKSRDFNFRQLGYIIANNSAENSSQNQRLLTLPAESIFNASNIGPNGFIFSDITDPKGQYMASGLLNTGYLMLTNELSSKFKLNWGVRAESYLEELNSKSTDPADDVQNTYFDILPSANLIYGVNPKSNLRLSYSNTVARAEFRELANFTFFDFETNNVVKGNSELKRTRINNYDLRFEHFPAGGQIFSVSVFYKDLSKAIEQVFDQGSTPASKTATYKNADKANIYGVEFEARQKLDILGKSKFLGNWAAYANVSLMKSDVSLKGANLNDKRPLQGQSPYLINAGLQYSDNKWSVNALYNKVGKRINVVGFGQYKTDGSYQNDYRDIVENPRDVIDLQISRRLLKNKAEIKFNINDILNQGSVLYQDSNDDGKYSNSQDRTIASRVYGTNVNLSLSYKL